MIEGIVQNMAKERESMEKEREKYNKAIKNAAPENFKVSIHPLNISESI